MLVVLFFFHEEKLGKVTNYIFKVKILVNSGAYLEARDTSERTALYLAAGRGHVEVVRYLISVGANVNGEEIHGKFKFEANITILIVFM